MRRFFGGGRGRYVPVFYVPAKAKDRCAFVAKNIEATSVKGSPPAFFVFVFWGHFGPDMVC